MDVKNVWNGVDPVIVQSADDDALLRERPHKSGDFFLKYRDFAEIERVSGGVQRFEQQICGPDAGGRTALDGDGKKPVQTDGTDTVLRLRFSAQNVGKLPA